MKQKNQLLSIKKLFRPKDKKNKKEGFSIYLRVTCLVAGRKESFELSSGQGFVITKEWNKASKELR